MKFTAAAITALGLTTLCFNGAKANEMKLRAREKMRKDKAERQLQANDSGLVFSRGYICITRQQDFYFIFREQSSSFDEEDINFLGSSTIQSGGIYDPADVQIVDRLGTSAADNFPVFFDDERRHLQSDDTAPAIFIDGRLQFAGQRQPKFIPQKDPGFFFNGECVATQVAAEQILGHSCLLNLCLGGGGYNCIAIYAGSKFVFSPLEQILFSPTTFNDDDDGADNPGSIVPSLPPSYPGTIIGGTGLFAGAVGYVDVTTITGSTLTPANLGSPSLRASYPQAGYITQKINVVTNVPLPVAP